mmetsp:Transcript_1980/g.4527  ORF Transcript_1980/g.4527 Transcript_1980/m.4527 type:complete len:277 (+) Transcript_1980:89-919(+)
MGKAFTEIPTRQQEFIRKQKIFFVGTANLDANGHINISPKGHDSFALINKNACAYLDLSGSGSETAAHLMQTKNGRITIMFVSFEGPPNILRLFGKGKYILRQNVPKDLLSRFPNDLVTDPGFRGVVYIDVHRVSTSCGYAVPYFDYKADRQVLRKTFKTKSLEEMDRYRVKKNSFSIDKLQSLGHYQETLNGEEIVMYDANGYWWGRPKSAPVEVKANDNRSIGQVGLNSKAKIPPSVKQTKNFLYPLILVSSLMALAVAISVAFRLSHSVDGWT